MNDLPISSPILFIGNPCWFYVSLVVVLVLIPLRAYLLGFSGRIPCPHKGRIWLEQRGLQRALYWHIEARVVLDLQEFPNSVCDFMNYWAKIVLFHDLSKF